MTLGQAAARAGACNARRQCNCLTIGLQDVCALMVSSHRRTHAERIDRLLLFLPMTVSDPLPADMVAIGG